MALLRSAGSKLISRVRTTRFTKALEKIRGFVESERGNASIEFTIDVADLALTLLCADPSMLLAKDIAIRALRNTASRFRGK